MYSENIQRKDHDHCWFYDEKQVHLESQLDPATQSLVSSNVEQFIDDKAEIIIGDDARKSFVSFNYNFVFFFFNKNVDATVIICQKNVCNNLM